MLEAFAVVEVFAVVVRDLCENEAIVCTWDAATGARRRSPWVWDRCDNKAAVCI